MAIIQILNSPNAERYIPVLQIMRDRGVDIVSSVNEMIAGDLVKYHFFSTTSRDEGALYRTLRYLKLVYHVDVWSLQLSQWRDLWLQPLQQRPKLLEQSLAHGFDPNSRKASKGFSILGLALMAVVRAKKKKRMGESIDLPLWHCLALLIKAKADIHYQRPQSFDHASHCTDIETISHYALSVDVGNEWDLALRECGLDPDDVYRENFQRMKRAFRLYGATRTGIDEQSLDVPSASGLRCRSCRRKVCQRDHGSFGFGR
ncbi:hypothetical protein BS50DRAFT_580735 [Corynespora cassiicola Philippines]|uniref:Uncharacterized protein n=1 Tax=Corynespora cassiicola Philippines TaxID=1448308 RepID=A0A2T2P882_CORCC|nr:hypothetical protein BS50DRAFT_580735 [Corynespora cassiicola Philippines]